MKRPAVFRLSAKEEDESKLWLSIFRLGHLQGVQVPDTSAAAGAAAAGASAAGASAAGAAAASASAAGDGPLRRFGFFMSTDGVGCSFKCERPKRESAPAHTASSVSMNEDTIFMAIDPGKSGVVGVEKCLHSGSGEDAQMGWPDGR